MVEYSNNMQHDTFIEEYRMLNYQTMFSVYPTFKMGMSCHRILINNSMFPVPVRQLPVHLIKIRGRYECGDMNQCKCIRQLLFKFCTGQINVTMCNYLFCFLRMYM